MGDHMKKILLAVIVSLLVPGLATAANITYADKVTGGSFSAADANEIKSAVNSKADALGADDNYVTDAEKTRIGELESTDVPVFAGADLGVANTTTGLLRFYGNAKAFSFGLWSQGADGTGIGWRLPSAMATGDSVIGVDTNGYLSYLPSTAIVASGFNGNLTTGDDTVQEIAQKFDDFTAAGTGDMILASAQTVTGKKTFENSDIALLGSSTGATTFASANTGATDYTLTFPAATGTVARTADIPDLTAPGAIGGTTPAAGTFTTVTAASYVSSAADGSRYTILPNNGSISPLGDGSEEIYNEGGQIKVVEADTEYDVLNSGNLATGVLTMLGNTPGAEGGPTTTIEYGTSALGTAEIASGVCASAVTTVATNVATTDVINWGFNGDPTGVTGYAPTANGMLTIIAYPTSGNVNFKVCNLTAAAITPGAVTLNWRIQR